MMFTMIYDIYGDIEWCLFDRGFEGSWDEIVDENPDLTMLQMFLQIEKKQTFGLLKPWDPKRAVAGWVAGACWGLLG